MTNELIKEYRKLDAVNWSSLKHIKVSPAYYLHKLEEPIKETDYMKLGSLIDIALLDGWEEVMAHYMVVPGLEMKTNLEKEDSLAAWNETFKEVGSHIPQADYEWLLKEKTKTKIHNYLYKRVEDMGFIPLPMEGKVFSYHTAKGAMEAQLDKPAWVQMKKAIKETQKPLTGVCKETGLKLKGLLDIVTENGIGDLKAISQMDKRMWTIKDRMYVNQVAFYRYLAELNGIFKTTFFLALVETIPPFSLKFVEIDHGALDRAHDENLGMLRTLKQCLDSGYFPDSSDEKETFGERVEEEERADVEFLASQLSEGEDRL